MTFQKLLAAEFAPYGELSQAQLDQLESHFKILTAWNTRLNLTRITSLFDVIRFHYCESLFLARFLPPGAQRIVDVGSGGGFPGIPAAILRPDCQITLVESHQRKAVFLKEASRNLHNVRVIPNRIEEVRESFDWVISRAVAPADIVRLDLAPSVALLIGEDDTTKLVGETVNLPWGEKRVLFHVKHQDTCHVEPKTC